MALFRRKCTLQVTDAFGNGLDLSEFRIVFHIEAHDEDHPGTAVIRVYNLRDDIVNQITDEYQVVTLQAGYANGPFGLIFIGSIKQFRIGKEDSVTKYLDLLCADQDVLYNATMLSNSMAAGWTPSRTIAEVVNAGNVANGNVPRSGQQISVNDFSTDFLTTAGVLPGTRGKVLYGSAKGVLKNTASTLNCSWSIQKGVLQVIPFDRYLPDEAVVLTPNSGVVGIPEVTNEGIKIKCLLNPMIEVGGTVQLNGALINQITQALGNQVPSDATGGSKGLAYNSAYGKGQLSFFATVGKDNKIYRVLVTEYEGDTRGHPWYVTLTALLTDASSKSVITDPTGTGVQ